MALEQFMPAIIKNNTIYYQGSLILDEDITVHNIETEIKRVIALK